MIIDCEECVMYQSNHCKDCFVTSILSRKGEVVELDQEQEQAVATLQDAGLAPLLRFERRGNKGGIGVG